MCCTRASCHSLLHAETSSDVHGSCFAWGVQVLTGLVQLLQDLDAAQRSETMFLANHWRKAFLTGQATVPTVLCLQRAEHLLKELDHLGFKGRPSAVQAACEALRANEQSAQGARLLEFVFRLWHQQAAV